MATRPLTDLAACLPRLTNPTGPGVPDAELLRRFADSRDEAAFELLLWRHGGMVLGTCRRVLGRSADADDAFQAAFLALARRAGSVRRGESLPGWLHRVALRAALRLRAAAGHRARRESHTFPESAVARAAPPTDDTGAVLDEEIGRLPDKLRAAFVLCELEGHTNEEAATRLGCPKGTVLSRLARARGRLRARLTRRGFAGAGPLVGPPAVLSAALVGGTARAGTAFATGTASGTVSGRVEALAHGVLRETAPGAPTMLGAALALALAVGAALAAGGPITLPPAVPVQPVAAPVPRQPPTNFKLALADKGVDWAEAVLFSPDGRWVVTTGSKSDGGYRVDVWDAATGRHTHTCAELGPKPSFRDGVVAAFSPDGKTLAVGFTTRRPTDVIRLWAAGTWAERAALPYPGVNALQFSPDSKLLVATTSYNKGPGGSRVWDAATGKLIHEQPEAGNTEGATVLYYAPVFSPDSKTFLIHSNAASVRAHGPAGELRFQLPILAENTGSHLPTFSPDGKAFAMRTPADGVRVSDATTGTVRFAIPAPDGDRQGAVRFSPDGTALLVTSYRLVRPADGRTHAVSTVRLHDAATGAPVRTFEPDVARLQSVAFSPDGKWIAGVSQASREFVWDADVWVWNAQTGTKTTLFARNTITGRSDSTVRVEDVRFSPDGKVVAVSGYEQRGNEHGSAAREELLREEIRSLSILCDPRTGRGVTLPGVRGVEFGPAGTVALTAGPLDSGRGRLKNERDEVTVRDLADLLKTGR